MRQLVLAYLLAFSCGVVRRQSGFDLHFAYLLDTSVCETDVNATCSHMMCAIYCLHESTWCTSFAYEEDEQSCTCSLCEYIDPVSLQPGDGIVGFMENHTVDCSDPPEVIGAKVTYESTSLGATATYDCNVDHTYVSGNETSTCGEDGFWNTVTLKCVRTGCYYWTMDIGRWMYDGQVSVTSSGLTCQAWNDVTPHVPSPSIIDELRTISVNDVNTNYCRMLGGDDVPWCYTTDPGTNLEHCDIPECLIHA